MSYSRFNNVTALLLALALGSLAAGCNSGARKARHVERADQYVTESRYAEAEIEYLNALKIDPADSSVVGKLATIYFEQGRVSLAFPFVMRASESDPDNLDLRIKSAQLHLAAGSAERARENAEFVLSRSPTNPEAPLVLAESARTTNDLAQARNRIEQLRREIGDTAALETAIGTLHFRAGDTVEAERALRRALALDDRFIPAHTALGTLSWTQGNLTNADASMRTAADLSPIRSPRRLRYAEFKIRTGQPEAGEAILTEITRQAPDFLPAWTALAERALERRDLTNCATYVNAALSRDADNITALVLRARLRIAEQNIEKAVIELEHLSQRFERSPQVWLLLANSYILANKPSEALTSVSRAVALDPLNDDALLLQAQLQARRGDVDSAVTALTRLVERRPESPQPALLLIDALLSRGNTGEALAECRRLSDQFPTNANLRLLAGNILLRQNQAADARREFERALELAPESLAALEQLVGLDIVERKPADALSRIETTSRRLPQSPVLPALVARVQMSQGNTNQAEAELLRAIDLDVNYQPAQMLLARLYIASGQQDKALVRLQHVVENNPADAGALLLMGVLQTEQRDYPAARASYEKLVSVNPNFAPAWNNLAYLYSEHLGELDKAHDAARKAHQLAPGDPACADTLGWILFKRGDYQGGLPLLQASANQLPEDPEVLFHLGMTRYMLGDEARARSLLNQAIEIAASGRKNFSGLAEARERVALLDIEVAKPDPTAIAALEQRTIANPQDPIARRKLGDSYRNSGQPEKAAVSYEEVLKQNPRDAKTMAALSSLLAANPETQKRALDLATEAHKIQPDDPAVAWILGHQVLEAGNHRWALSLFQESAQRSAPTPDQLYDLALAQYYVGRIADAEASLRRAQTSEANFERQDDVQLFLELLPLSSSPARAVEREQKARTVLQSKPTYLPALAVLAESAAHRNEIVDAVKHYEEILKRYPEFLPATRAIAILLADEPGDLKTASDAAMKARQAMPDDPELARAMGKVLYRQGDYRGASRLLQDGLREGQPDGRAVFYLGMSQLRLNNTEAARETLTRALTFELPEEQAAAARQALSGMN